MTPWLKIMMDTTEYRFIELREDALEGRTLTGVVMTYGDVSRHEWGEETFEPGAFLNLEGRQSEIVRFNLMHVRERMLARVGGGMVLTDSPDQLLMTARIAATRDGDEAITLYREGVLRGLSAEFQPVTERYRGRRRIVQGARLTGVGFVDVPAFPGSVPISVRRAETLGNRRRRICL